MTNTCFPSISERFGNYYSSQPQPVRAILAATSTTAIAALTSTLSYGGLSLITTYARISTTYSSPAIMVATSLVQLGSSWYMANVFKKHEDALALNAALPETQQDANIASETMDSVCAQALKVMSGVGIGFGLRAVTQAAGLSSFHEALIMSACTAIATTYSRELGAGLTVGSIVRSALEFASKMSLDDLTGFLNENNINVAPETVRANLSKSEFVENATRVMGDEVRRQMTTGGTTNTTGPTPPEISSDPDAARDGVIISVCLVALCCICCCGAMFCKSEGGPVGEIKKKDPGKAAAEKREYDHAMNLAFQNFN